VFIDFLGRLLRDCGGRKVHLIVDGHPVHRAKAVSAWVGRHGERIQLHVLPPGYSPELNPVELLNMTSRRMPRAGGVPGRRRRVAMSCTAICVGGNGTPKSSFASSTIRRPVMPPPHDHTICLPW
jgi:hypothetical protein